MLTKIKSLFEKYNSRMKEILDFLKTANAGYLTSEGLRKKIKDDKEKIREDLKTEVNNLLNETRNKILIEEKNLFRNKYPLLTSTDPAEKLNGEIQLKAAKDILSKGKEDVLTELEFSKNSNRLDLLNYILDSIEKINNEETKHELQVVKEKFYSETKLLEPLENAKYENKLMNFMNSHFEMEELPERIFFPFSMSEIKSMPQNVVNANIDAVNQSMMFHNSK